MKITHKNCSALESTMPVTGDTTAQVRAWQTVFLFCQQNGMKLNTKGDNAITAVIKFIHKKTA